MYQHNRIRIPYSNSENRKKLPQLWVQSYDLDYYFSTTSLCFSQLCQNGDGKVERGGGQTTQRLLLSHRLIV